MFINPRQAMSPMSTMPVRRTPMAATRLTETIATEVTRTKTRSNTRLRVCIRLRAAEEGHAHIKETILLHRYSTQVTNAWRLRSSGHGHLQDED